MQARKLQDVGPQVAYKHNEGPQIADALPQKIAPLGFHIYDNVPLWLSINST